ncbi:hypothetical protein ACSBR2_012544 [Camellia fascicularis]
MDLLIQFFAALGRIWILNINNVSHLLLQIDDVVNWMLTMNGDNGVGIQLIRDMLFAC